MSKTTRKNSDSGNTSKVSHRPKRKATRTLSKLYSMDDANEISRDLAMYHDYANQLNLEVY
jgi:hypothetical protein